MSTAMPGVGLHLQSLVLDRARESAAHASAVQASPSAGQPAAQAAVVLELSAAAQQLVGS